MFEKGYDFHFVLAEPATPEDAFEKVFIYKFINSKGTPYIVRVEQYPYQVFAIKFYAKKHRQAPNRYSLLTNEGNPATILRTCIDIFIRDILAKEPSASMGFIGAPSEGESKEETQRFRIYRYIMENFFGVAKFSHHFYMKKSVYLVLNRLNKTENVLKKIEATFAGYDLFEDK